MLSEAEQLGKAAAIADLHLSLSAEGKAALAEATGEAIKTAAQLAAYLQSVINSDYFQKIRNIAQHTQSFLNSERVKEVLAFFADFSKEYGDLAPFILETLGDYQAENGIDGFTLVDFLNLPPGDPLVKEIVTKARQKKVDFEVSIDTVTTIEQAAQELPTINYKPLTKLEASTDKLTSLFFSLAAPPASDKAINGQQQMIPLKYEGKKSKREITLFYDYVFDEKMIEKHGLSKKFDDFDFFVMTVCDNLYDSGNDVVSLTKIYKEMGGDDKATGKQLEPILDSLRKGMSTIVTINDREVQEAWNSNPKGKYREIESPVMPVQLGTERFVANGKVAEGYVKINGRSPFLRVAAPIKHITTWDKDVLRLYKGRRTKRYYSVLRFLMQQIGWMRNTKGTIRSNKILYSALYDYTGDTTRQTRANTRDMMYRLLDEVFIPLEYVTAYRETATPEPGVMLTLPAARIAGH